MRCKRAHFLRERKSKSIQKIWKFKKIRASLTQISSDSDASRALSRSQTRHRLDRKMRRHRAFVAAHVGRVLLLRCASKSQEFLNEFPHFSPTLRESDAERAQPRCHTPRRLDRALRRRRTFLCTASDASAHTFCENENRKAFKKFGNLKKIRASLTQTSSDSDASRALSRS